MVASIRIAVIEETPETLETLADILIEVVANGGSVTFMHPLSREAALYFWKDSLARATAGDRVVLGAWEADELISTVTLDLATPQNPRHRAGIAKLMTRISHRGRGAARGLMLKAERIAVERGRTLLTLDTAEDGGAAALYESIGYERVGVIPDYALKPHGGLTGTILYFKRIGQTPAMNSVRPPTSIG